MPSEPGTEIQERSSPQTVSPTLEIALLMIFVVVLYLFAVYDFDTGPRWVDPGARLATFAVSIMGAAIGVRKGQMDVATRLPLIVFACLLISAAWSIFRYIFPEESLPGDPILLGRQHPEWLAVFTFFAGGLFFSVIGIFAEEMTALGKTCLIWLTAKRKPDSPAP